MSDHIRLERDGPIAHLFIDRPERRNAMDGPMWTALGAHVRSQFADPPRALIVHGTGENFCAGMDLAMTNPLLQLLGPAAASKDQVALREIIEDLKKCVGALVEAPFPTIAAIEGACLGGGLEIALACDLRVGSTSSFYAMPETRVGLAPDVGGIVRLSRLVGRARATELILTGSRINAKVARRWGLLNSRAGTGGALAMSQAMAEQIAKGGPKTTTSVLKALRRVEGVPLAKAFDMETRTGIDVLLAGEWMEGATAFMEKREPKWTS